MSHFLEIDRFPDDPILQLPIAFAADKHERKVNLGIGAYKDATGKPFVLSSVAKAEEQICNRKLDKEYLPIAGSHEYIKESFQLVFGAPQTPLAFAMQTVGGTSALRLGSEFLAKNGFKDIFVSNPSWPTHKLIFGHAGLHFHTYPYYDEKTQSLNFSGMCDAIRAMPKKSIILLHASCHNPTGIDPTNAQWEEMSHLIKQQGLIPFFDLAYQGFGHGLDQDAFAVRHFMEKGHEMFVATSYAKNMGLYGERVGLLVAFTKEKEATEKVASQLKQLARSSYSNPPLHGSRIVTTILQSAELHREWLQELEKMRHRIHQMRNELVEGLTSAGVHANWEAIRQQTGIFSLIGLNPDHVQMLIREQGIYLPANGRINVAGLTNDNIDRVVEALSAVMKR
ncbi:MAG: aspartate/tyrosine/aromatic aminotransferase [Parachlamydiaceae bacterium]|nr:aspartate/tyrosine/aromatic aminotransferase [Parachlamydiaceae bacterium]